MSTVLDSALHCRMLFSGPVPSESAIILLRSRIASTTRRLGFSDLERANVALVAAEIASNQLKHASGRGMVQIWQQPGGVLDLFGLDYGPGIANLPAAEEDGFSTANTLGKGLGSIRRLADQTAVYTQPQQGAHCRWNGTAVLARFRAGRESEGAESVRGRFETGLFARALSDERYNGDRVYIRQQSDRLRWLHVDGLGHGERAHAATADLGSHLLADDPAQVLKAVDRQLTGSRGAVGVLGELQLSDGAVSFHGVGDMHAHLFDGEQMQSVAFAPGILGREHGTPMPWNSDGTRIALTASDGIRRNWDNGSFPGLFNHHPQLIAYVLGNIMGRMSDDQSLYVARVQTNKRD